MGLEERLAQIADESEIRNLLARLAHTADGGTLEEYAALFTEDAVWDGGAVIGVRRGLADILQGATERRANGVAGPGTHTLHVITTSAVQVAGDRGFACSYFLFYGNCDKEPAPRVVGVYRDEMRRTPSGWKLAHRRIQPA